jgi:hypothetical protein
MGPQVVTQDIWRLRPGGFVGARVC